MRLLKYISIVIGIAFVIISVLFYIFYQKYNLENIIKKIELNNNVKIDLIQNPKWNLFPKIIIDFNIKLKDKFNKFYAENISISLEQLYNFVPINFNLKTDTFYMEGLEIKLIKLNGNYYFIDNNINIKNLQANISSGSIITKGKINLSNKKQIELFGNLKNIHLNQILKQLKLADWQRIELRLSSNNFKISSSLKNNSLFINNLQGIIPVKGSMYFVSTEEERFGIAFFNLLVEKMLPEYKKMSESLSQIINNFSDSPALYEGTLNIKNGMIHTSNLSVKNNKNKINIEGSYNFRDDYFNANLYFIESEKIVVEATIEGNLENPSIKIINDNKIYDNQKINNDLKSIFKEGIGSLLDKLLELNE